MWIVAAIFYLAAFYLRTSPAVMTTELMRDFGIAASQLGQFSAFYFYAYVAMQIPTGVLVDSWGARRLLISGSIGAAAGMVLFGTTSHYALASLGRAIVGASTAVGWVVTLKLATHWFPKRRFAMLSGLGLMMGNIGALFAQVPLRLLVEAYGWRAVALGSAVCVLAIGGAAWAFVANDPADVGYASLAPPELQRTNQLTLATLLREFPNLFTHRNTWLIFLAQGGFVGAMLSFTGLWGPPYLRQRFALSSTRAAAVCSVMIVCWAVASPLAGYCSDRIGRRKPIYLGGALGSAAGWALLFYAPLPLAAFVVVAALTSFACGAVVVAFAFAKESVPVRFLGTISGAVNVGNMLGPTLLQPAIGWALDRRWDGVLANGVRIYSVDAFTAAFATIVAWSLLSCVLIAITRETGCRQTELPT
ncbi:MAG TPA: MFS transporter [Vicinamibacterales bacterium]|nr:MFS transporter [Vicinamibacterales bacterium]